ncbi:MAG: hypothetical protein ACOH5I_15265 [Oligoflexus sp.]
MKTWFNGKSLILFLLAWFSCPVYAIDDKKLDEVESILDRLERQLIERERRNLFPGTKPTDSEKKGNVDHRIIVEPSMISGRLPDQGALDEFASTIDQIEDELASLGGELENLKQKIRRGTQSDSLIEISAMIPNPDQVSIREFEIKLDGFTIYQLNRSGGLWLPRQQIPIFAGPLASGPHEIELHARIVKKMSDDLPVDSSTFHLYRQKFQFEVKEGIDKKGFRITMGEVVEQNIQAQAKIEAYEI